MKLKKKKKNAWNSSSIPITTFKESYSDVLNGTQAPRTRVPQKFFFYFLYIYIYIYFFFFLKFDCLIPIAAFRESYNGVLNGT